LKCPTVRAELFIPPTYCDDALILWRLRYNFTLPTARNTVFKIDSTVCENTRRPIDKWEERRMNEVEDLIVRSRMPIFFVIWNVLEYRNSGFECILQVGWNSGIGFDDIAIINLDTAGFLEDLCFVLELLDTIISHFLREGGTRAAALYSFRPPSLSNGFVEYLGEDK
jgi:hypothetical protein